MKSPQSNGCDRHEVLPCDFNPSFSLNVETNLGKEFLKIIRAFPKIIVLAPIVNTNTIKISYQTQQNMGGESWELELTDFFVIIPNTTFLMFCLQMGITLPANSLKKFVVEYWGKDLDNPQLYFKSSEFEDKVGNFARCPVARGRKLGKLFFVFSEDSVAHSGKLWHCSGCGRGFPTKAFFSKQKEGEGCQLFESVLLIGRKKLG